MYSNSIARRTFVKKSLIGFGGLVMLQRCSFEPNYLEFLSKEEARLLDAIAEQFIPTDQDPGAKEACVVNFIDTQLTKNYKRFQQNYRQGLEAFKKTCKDVKGKIFESLRSDEQIAFLELIESGDVPETYWDFQKPATFLRLMLSHCMQGFYGDPRHGGNCNHVSYKMINLQVIQFYHPETTAAS